MCIMCVYRGVTRNSFPLPFPSLSPSNNAHILCVGAAVISWSDTSIMFLWSADLLALNVAL